MADKGNRSVKNLFIPWNKWYHSIFSKKFHVSAKTAAKLHVVAKNMDWNARDFDILQNIFVNKEDKECEAAPKNWIINEHLFR